MQRSVLLLSTLLVVLFASQTTSVANSGTATPSASANPSSLGQDNYPPSRFQAGRPSSVTGLRVLSLNAANKTVTLQWNKNPEADQVDQYAIYYRAEVPAPFLVYEGVLIAVIAKNSITSSILGLDSTLNSYPIYPYGQNEIPVCHPSNCPGDPDKANVWVIAHNKFGWGDNYEFAANPDENPADFSTLSDNQTRALKPPKLLNLNLIQISPNFVKTPWTAPTSFADYSDLKLQVGTGVSQQDLVGSKWTVPWVPDIHWPNSRFGPGRPEVVSGLRVTKLNLKTKQIAFTWKPNPTSEKVDSYAIYLAGTACPDDQCTNWLVQVVKNNFLSQNLTFKSLPYMDSYGKVSDGKTLTLAPTSRSYGFWVIAHNKYGWGDNDPRTPNPDQETGDFRPPSRSESKLANSLFPANMVDVSIPCSVLPISQRSSC